MNEHTPEGIEAGLTEYLCAAYGNPHKMSGLQMKEIRQAFLAGVVWRDSEEMPAGKCEEALRQILGMTRERN